MHQNPSEHFGRAVRELRLGAGLTLEVLADQADLSPTYLGQVERGVRSPSLRVIYAIADGLEREPWQILEMADQLEHEEKRPQAHRKS